MGTVRGGGVAPGSVGGAANKDQQQQLMLVTNIIDKQYCEGKSTFHWSLF